MKKSVVLISVLLSLCTVAKAGPFDPWGEDFRHQPLGSRPHLDVAFAAPEREKFRIDAQEYCLIGELRPPHRLVEERSGEPWLWMEVTDTQGKLYSTRNYEKASRINLYRRGAYYCEVHWFDMMPVGGEGEASNLSADLALYCYPEKILAKVTWHAREDFPGAKLHIGGIAPREFDLKPFRKGDAQSFAFALFGEEPPLPDEAFELLKGAVPVKYDPVRGCYRVGTNFRGNFQDEFYRTPNRYETASIRVTNDSRKRKIYVCHESAVGRAFVAGGVLTDEKENPLPILVQISKNFAGEKEESFYNPKDIPFSETFFPLYLAPGESRTLNSSHLYQNWGRHMTKHWSSLGAWMDYFHSATGVTETTCYVPFKYGGIRGISIADLRAMSQQSYWASAPQHDNVAGHAFLSYFAGKWQFPEYTRTRYRSTGPNWFDIGLEYLTTDGRIRATVDTWETPQTDELRSYFRVRYEVLEPVTVTNAATDFRLLSIHTRVQSLRYTRFAGTGIEEVRLDSLNRPFPVSGAPLPAGNFHITLYGDTTLDRGSNSIVVNRFSAPFSPAATVQQGPYKNSAAFPERPQDAVMCLVPAQNNVELKKGDTIEIEGYWFSYGDASTTAPAERCARDYGDNAPRITHIAKGRRIDGMTALWVEVEQDEAEFTVAGGRNLVPVVVTGLSGYRYPRMQIFEGGKWREAGHNRNTATDGYQTFCAEDGSFGAIFLVSCGPEAQRLRVNSGNSPAPSSKIALDTNGDRLVEARNAFANVRLRLPAPTRSTPKDEPVSPVWEQSQGNSLFYTQTLSSWQRGGRLSPNQEDVDLEYWWQNKVLSPAHAQPVFDLEPASGKLLKGKYMVLTEEGWQEISDGEKLDGTIFAAGVFAPNGGAVLAFRSVCGVSRTGTKLQISLDAPAIAPGRRYHQRGKLYLTGLGAEELKTRIINDPY